MFIQSEKDLEDYICENMEGFKKFLKDEVFKNDTRIQDIHFIGRQVNVGGNFIDLLFDSWDEPDDLPVKFRTFIVVELKFRDLIAKDLAQVSRYINLLDSFITDEDSSYETSPSIGVLIGPGLDDDMQEIEMCLDRIDNLTRIYFAELDVNVAYNTAHYSFNDDFIDSLKFDKRITDTNFNSD